MAARARRPAWASGNTATLADWTNLVHTLVPATRRDDYTPQLAEHLADLAGTGIDAHALLHTTTGAPLPDDHAASALWWRIQNHLPDPHHLGEPAPLEWPAEDDTAVRDRDDGSRQAGRATPQRPPRASPGPGPHDQPRGPGMTR